MPSFGPTVRLKATGLIVYNAASKVGLDNRLKEAEY